MHETKVIYHIDEQETPYLIKIPKSSEEITLGELKNALNRLNYKYFFKSMDVDFGVVKEEILDDKAILPSFNGRIITWLVTKENSTSDTTSQNGNQLLNKTSLDSLNRQGRLESGKLSSQSRSPSSRQSPKVAPPLKPHRPPQSSVFSSDLDTTSFVDSDDDTNTRLSSMTNTTTQSSRIFAQRKKKKKHKLPVLSQASSFSSITDSTMSLNIISITLNMETASFLGISIVGQSSRGGDGGIYVGSIMRGGAVAQDGRIEPGDMILEVNGVSFENTSNDDAVTLLREAVQKPGPITLVVAKCWDPTPHGYSQPSLPHHPIRPIDPSAWIMHQEALKWTSNGDMHTNMTNMPIIDVNRNVGDNVATSVATSARDFVIRPAHSSATSTSSHSSKGYTDLHLTKNADMACVARAMAQPNSGLEVRDRMWLKIPIPNSFIGSDVVNWLFSRVEGFVDRRDARRYACNLLKHGFINHTVNKISFSEQCYYVFGSSVLQDMANLSLIDDIDSVSSIGMQHTNKSHETMIAPLPPPPTWAMPGFPSRPTYPLPPNVYSPSNLGPLSTPYNKIVDGASYISMPGYNGADSVVSSVKQNRTCNCLVSHTYKQFKKLWEGADKKDRGGSNVAMKHVVGGGGLIADRLVAKKFEVEHSTNSETESGDSTSSQSKGDKGGKKTGADSGLGSGERSLPPLPPHTPLQTSDNNKTCLNSPSNNSNTSNSNNPQHYKLPNNNQLADESIHVMGDL